MPIFMEIMKKKKRKPKKEKKKHIYETMTLKLDFVVKP
jgi:hypothetical protein